jgi:hypothetical protein
MAKALAPCIECELDGTPWHADCDQCNIDGRRDDNGKIRRDYK